MSKRSAYKRDHDHDHCDDSSDDDSTPQSRRGPKKEKKSKIKWSGIFLIGLFVIPGLLGAFMFAFDYIFPEDAKMRKLKNPLVRCYSAANPSKLSEIDHLLKKYEGKEGRLYDQVCRIYIFVLLLNRVVDISYYYYYYYYYYYSHIFPDSRAQHCNYAIYFILHINNIMYL